MNDIAPSLPGPFLERVRRVITPQMRESVMDEQDPERHLAALVRALEDNPLIVAGLQRAYLHPGSRVVFHRATGEVLLQMASPDGLIGEDGSVALVCDQYAYLVRRIFARSLSTRVIDSSTVFLSNPGSSMHIGARLYVPGYTQVTSAVPRWYKGRVWQKKITDSFEQTLLWQSRRMGKSFAGHTSFFPFTEITYKNGYIMISAALRVDEKSGFVLGSLLVQMPDGESFNVITKLKLSNMDGRIFHASDLFSRVVCFHDGERFLLESAPIDPVIKNNIADAMAVLLSKKLEVA